MYVFMFKVSELLFFLFTHLSAEHLETKKQIETLREKFGEENWLHSHAGSCVQDLLGLHKVVTVPSPAKCNVQTPPRHLNITTVTATDVVGRILILMCSDICRKSKHIGES
jgi:hypothetical protein